MRERILDGRVAVITGASRGLGRAMALALGGAGARLALVARDASRLDEVVREAGASGMEAAAFPFDVSREDRVAALEKAVIERFGTAGILINNAGINVRRNLTDFTLEEWNRVIGTNLTGAFLMCRAIVPHMKGQGYGRIINMTSMMAHISLPGRAAYSASKAGLLGMTRALALELAADGITVVGISPGPFATEMNGPLLNDPRVNEQFTSRIPVGHWGKVEDIGSLALYLCSDAASFLTGTDIVIDGGWMAQ
ncbi:MAG: SDR family NAD(P)-dependent oxidoreductase [Bryobacteraceae bacterium]|jgi:NAD(P)-dependent dehydrogenase (short-subunit alcohol dehydrogenase family)